MNKRTIKILLLLAILIFCTSCDLSTKWLAKQRLEYARPVTIIENFVELRYTENEAIAFSMLHSLESGLRKWLIYSLSLVAMIFLTVLTWQVRHQSLWWLVSLTLIFSGALGNLLERLARGYVIDFIHLHYYDRFSWPVFNAADIFITCGAILLGILTFRQSPESTLITDN
ncbi:MAG: signal peptidase II [Candidatus Zhuqueibacterota bacterium]